LAVAGTGPGSAIFIITPHKVVVGWLDAFPPMLGVHKPPRLHGLP